MVGTRKAAKSGRFRLGAQRDAARDVVRLTWRYVLQETLGPLKVLAKRAALGLAGVVLLAVGFVVVLIALLRVLQGETGGVFVGTWNFAPYLLTGVAALLVICAATGVALRAGARRRG